MISVLTDTNPKAFDVGEYFILEALNTGESRLVTAVLDHWVATHNVSNVKHSSLPLRRLYDAQSIQADPSELDVIHSSVCFVSRQKLKDTQCLALVESAVYCATVDRQIEILQVCARNKVIRPLHAHVVYQRQWSPLNCNLENRNF